MIANAIAYLGTAFAIVIAASCAHTFWTTKGDGELQIAAMVFTFVFLAIAWACAKIGGI